MIHPFFSIIVPVYLIEAYLAGCVNSILGQTFTDFELILVDDGSPDNCPRICDDYAEQDLRINVIHKKNEGVVKARNSAMDIAKGLYIVFVDGDDWIDSDLLKLYHDIIEQDDPDLVISRCHCVDDGKKTTIQQYPVRPGLYTGNDIKKLRDLMFYSGSFYEYYINPGLCGKAYKKGFLYPVIMAVDPQICVGEDLCCIYSCLLDADRISVCDEEGRYHYRKSSGSSTQYRSGYTENIIRVFSFLEEVIRTREGEAAVVKLDYNKIYSAYIGAAYILSPKNGKQFSVKMKEIERLLGMEIYRTALNRTRLKTGSTYVRKRIVSAMKNKQRIRLCLYIYIEKILVKSGLYRPKNGV